MLVKLNHVKLTRKFSNVYFQAFQMHTKFPSNSKWSEWWHLGGWVSHLVSSHFLLVALDYSPASLSRLYIVNSHSVVNSLHISSILLHNNYQNQNVPINLKNACKGHHVNCTVKKGTRSTGSVSRLEIPKSNLLQRRRNGVLGEKK